MRDLFRLRNQILNLRRECEVTMSDVIVQNVDNQLDKAQPVCLQQGEIEEELVKSFRAESS
jgi:hypothetical protein